LQYRYVILYSKIYFSTDAVPEKHYRVGGFYLIFNFNKMKKMFKFVAVALFATAVLTSCGGDKKDGDKKEGGDAAAAEAGKAPEGGSQDAPKTEGDATQGGDQATTTPEGGDQATTTPEGGEAKDAGADKAAAGATKPE
jgi:hypothetical protein